MKASGELSRTILDPGADRMVYLNSLWLSVEVHRFSPIVV